MSSWSGLVPGAGDAEIRTDPTTVMGRSIALTGWRSELKFLLILFQMEKALEKV